jgi:hypothetical protein
MPDEIRFLAVTPNIDRAIREKLLGNAVTTDLTGDETSSRKQELVSDIPENTSETQYSYNGYFTIKLRTLEDGTQKIVVCDGATYDAEKHTSGDMLVRVNQVVFTVSYTELPISEGYAYIVILYTPPRLDANGNVIDHGNQSVSIQALKNIEDDTRPYYILGNYSYVNGVLKVIQRHGTVPTTYMSNGVADIEYFIKC